MRGQAPGQHGVGRVADQRDDGGFRVEQGGGGARRRGRGGQVRAQFDGLGDRGARGVLGALGQQPDQAAVLEQPGGGQDVERAVVPQAALGAADQQSVAEHGGAGEAVPGVAARRRRFVRGVGVRLEFVAVVAGTGGRDDAGGQSVVAAQPVAPPSAGGPGDGDGVRLVRDEPAPADGDRLAGGGQPEQGEVETAGGVPVGVRAAALVQRAAAGAVPQEFGVAYGVGAAVQEADPVADAGAVAVDDMAGGEDQRPGDLVAGAEQMRRAVGGGADLDGAAGPPGRGRAPRLVDDVQRSRLSPALVRPLPVR